MIQKSYDNSPTLYLVPTPIGNMEDMTFRAVSVLKDVDILLCEDTRTSSSLLKYYDINKKLLSCHEYNEDKIKNKIIGYLKDGKNLALITDQGTPIISDPGFVISKYVIDNGYNVVSLPGATAFVPALTSSGLVPQPFLFYGFLNPKSSKMKEELESLKKEKYSIIFYEAPHRILDTVNNILEVFGDREVSINREISKIHEEIFRGKLSEFASVDTIIKGEFVIVVAGNNEEENYDNLSIVEHVKLYLDDMSEMEAIKRVAHERGVSKSIIYKEYHNNK